MDKHTPFWITTVASTPLLPTTATAMTIVDDTGMPTVPFDAVIRRQGTYPTNTTATVVRITARTGTSITAMTREVGGMSLYPISAGDEVYQSMDGLFNQIRLGTATLAALQAAVDLYPGSIITWPENSPYTCTLSSETVALTPTHNGTSIIIPESSPITPAAGSTAQSLITVTGTVGSTKNITASTRGSRVVTMANTSGIVAGDEVYFIWTAGAVAGAFRARVTSVAANVSITLDIPVCQSANAGTVQVVTPVKNVRVDIMGDGTGNTGTSSRLLYTQYTSGCTFRVKGQAFGGSLHLHHAGFKDTCYWDATDCGDTNVDYGDGWSERGSTLCHYEGISNSSDGRNSFYLSYDHYATFDFISNNAAGRGIKLGGTCGSGQVEITGAGTTGLAFSDRAHDCHVRGHIRHSTQYGIWGETAGGDYTQNCSFIGVASSNGDAGVTYADALINTVDISCYYHLLNSDAIIHNNGGTGQVGSRHSWQSSSGAVINNTTTETSVFDQTIYQSNMGKNSMVKVRLPFTVANTSGGNRTIRIRIYGGAAAADTLFDDSTLNIASGASYAGVLEFEWGNLASLSVQNGNGTLSISAGSAAATGVGDFGAAELLHTPFLIGASAYASATSNLELKVTFTLSNNDFNVTTTRTYSEMLP